MGPLRLLKQEVAFFGVDGCWMEQKGKTTIKIVKDNNTSNFCQSASSITYVEVVKTLFIDLQLSWIMDIPQYALSIHALLLLVSQSSRERLLHLAHVSTFNSIATVNFDFFLF